MDMADKVVNPAAARFPMYRCFSRARMGQLHYSLSSTITSCFAVCILPSCLARFAVLLGRIELQVLAKQAGRQESRLAGLHAGAKHL